jgi:hypothetical protein
LQPKASTPLMPMHRYIPPTVPPSLFPLLLMSALLRGFTQLDDSAGHRNAREKESYVNPMNPEANLTP